MAAMEEKPKKGRGRPVGANSFTTVRMKDLMRFVGEEGVVKVSRVWLKEIGLTLTEEVATIAALPDAAQKEEEKPIEFNVTTWTH
jgi:hypothetical protein